MKKTTVVIGIFSVLLFILSLNFLISDTANNFSYSWTCLAGANGNLGYCSNDAYVGWVRQVYGWSSSDWKRAFDLTFNVPASGNYSCNVLVTGTDYGYYDGAQTDEYENVSINGFSLGFTNDPVCNAGSVCHDYGNYTTAFNKNITLNSGTNYLNFQEYASHALRNVSISCNYIASNSINNTNQTNQTTSLPLIQIVSPNLALYNYTNILINLSYSNASNIWFNWNGTNQSYTSPVYVDFRNNGTYTIFAYANNTLGNISYVNKTFVINTTSSYINNTNGTIPNITIISPVNNSFYNTTYIMLDATSNQVILNSNWNFSLNNGVNTSFVPGNYINFINLLNGSNRLIIYGWNVNGTGQSSVVFFYNVFTNNINNTNQTNQTTSLPLIQIVSPNLALYNYTNILINLSYSNASNIWFNWNGTNQSYTSPVYVDFRNNGTYTIFAYANNTLGNISYVNKTFRINTTTINNNNNNDDDSDGDITLHDIDMGDNSYDNTGDNRVVLRSSSSGNFGVASGSNSTLMLSNAKPTDYSIWKTLLLFFFIGVLVLLLIILIVLIARFSR